MHMPRSRYTGSLTECLLALDVAESIVSFQLIDKSAW